MSNLLQEAIADANRVKELAFENAKAAIAEAFQPRIQRMISSRLAEEGEDFGFEEPEDDMLGTLGGGDDMTVPPVDDTEEDSFMESEFSAGDFSDVEDLGDTGDDEFDQQLEALIRELDGEVDTMEPEASTGEFDDEFSDDVTIEAIARGLAETDGDGYDDKFGKKRKHTEIAEVAHLRKMVSRLKSENRDALRAISTLKSAMNEVNLLNAKLMFSSKVMQRFDLTEGQQVKILEAFDRANSIREARLIYETISTNYQGQRKVARAATKPVRTVNESASRPIRTVKRTALNEQYEFANRWQVLAGLRKIND